MKIFHVFILATSALVFTIFSWRLFISGPILQLTMAFIALGLYLVYKRKTKKQPTEPDATGKKDLSKITLGIIIAAIAIAITLLSAQIAYINREFNTNEDIEEYSSDQGYTKEVREDKTYEIEKNIYLIFEEIIIEDQTISLRISYANKGREPLEFDSSNFYYTNPEGEKVYYPDGKTRTIKEKTFGVNEVYTWKVETEVKAVGYTSTTGTNFEFVVE